MFRHKARPGTSSRNPYRALSPGVTLKAGKEDSIADIAPPLLNPARFFGDWADAPLPLAFVALDTLVVPPVLPPFPLIGIGDAKHPAARWVDATVERPVTATGLAKSVDRNPRAAAVCIELLRSITGISTAPALTIESLAYAALQGSAEHDRWRATRPAVPATPSGRVDLRRDGDVLHVTIDRPAARNAIDRTLRDALHEAFSVAALDGTVERVIVRSTGPAFSVGADLAEFGTTDDPATAHRIRAATLPAHPLSRCAAITEVHVQGACIGAGLEMAAFAGRVIASAGAWFQLPELAMGLIPGAGGCVSIAQRIGRQRTALLVLSGKRIGAQTALDWGLIDAIEDPDPVNPRR